MGSGSVAELLQQPEAFPVVPNHRSGFEFGAIPEIKTFTLSY